MPSAVWCFNFDAPLPPPLPDNAPPSAIFGYASALRRSNIRPLTFDFELLTFDFASPHLPGAGQKNEKPHKHSECRRQDGKHCREASARLRDKVGEAAKGLMHVCGHGRRPGCAQGGNPLVRRIDDPARHIEYDSRKNQVEE